MSIENQTDLIPGAIEPVLHEIFAVHATREDDVFVVDVEITDMNGERYRCDYVSRPEDTFGIAPELRNRLATNGHEIVPFVEPTLDQKRAEWASITAKQLRLALIRSGISQATVDAAIDGLPEGQAKEEAEVEWEYTTEYRRVSPALLTITGAIGFTQSEVDDLWSTALAIAP